MVDSSSLENCHVREGVEGSNPSVTAKYGVSSLEVEASPCEGGEVRALLIGHPIMGARLSVGRLVLDQ